MNKTIFLNASGTHRKMSKNEIYTKLGLSRECESINFFNHEYHSPNQVIAIDEIPSNFVSNVTNNLFNTKILVTVNKLLLEKYDLIIVLSGTVPHESTGYSGGLKTFFPGISGPEVISLFHWTAAIIGIPNIIGTINNPARDIINKGSSSIFRNNIPIVSFNMVSIKKNETVIPKGLYIGIGYEGFLKSYHKAATASSKLHIVYIEKPLDVAVQVINDCYDEIWTAAKGSYKLQITGVMSNGGEIIIYAPHITRFHSNPQIDDSIKTIGYRGIHYVLNFLRSNPNFCRNVAAHILNLRGHGIYNQIEKREEFPVKITLATSIPKDVCTLVGLNYRDPKTLNQKDFTESRKLWIQEGGKYLFKLKTNMENNQFTKHFS
jgi:nickel-dependent lactate racemase